MNTGLPSPLNFCLLRGGKTGLRAILTTTGLVCSMILASVPCHAGNGSATLIGWNNLGMHCMDDDYSIFSILPPYNTVDAQLIDGNGRLVRLVGGYTVTYQAMADPDGSINRTVAGKTNFWTHAPKLFGASLPLEAGLGGTSMPGALNSPQPFTWVAGINGFEALGIPIIPTDDQGRANSYPMMRLVAKNASNAVIATTDVVLPVSGEMNCRACHASNSGAEARPASGWVNDPDPKHDYRLNVLLLHDEKFAGQPVYSAALAANGYHASGLYATVVKNNRPVLCAQCHASEALGTGGYPGVPPLTRSIHARHANVTNPANNLPMDSVSNRSACYQCHPGAETRCLRGAMGSAVASDGSLSIQCQSCHGTMSQVGASTRTGWLDEPNCQSCHSGNAVTNNGQIRYTTSFDPQTGQMRVPVANTLPVTFATNTNVPAAGKSLYRFSSGHGGLQCSACHGSTHAEFPSIHRNDNIQSVNLQGHAGVLSDCTACHAAMPVTVNGGPHGMHPIGQSWVDGHHDSIGGNLTQCKACHGLDYRGTVLSRAQGNRSFNFRGTAKAFWRGQQVGCYDCHNGIDTDAATRKVFPVVPAHTALATPGSPVSLTLSASGVASSFRIVRQPLHGTVGLAGSMAVYYPEAGYNGPDAFTYAARDATNFVDSNQGMVSITVGPAGAVDSDGISMLVKYALGLTPGFPVRGGGWSFTMDPVGGQHFLAITAVRSLPPGDVMLSLEESSDLITWTPGNVITNSNTLFMARDSVAVETANKRFIRLKITRP